MTINDFAFDDPVSFEVNGGSFEYIKLSVKRELAMDTSKIVDEKGTFDMQLFTLYKIAYGLVKVPYDKETINKVIEKEAEWSELNIDEKIALLNVLSSNVFAEISINVNAIENSVEELKKKS